VNWEALGAVAEFVAALGVIISFFYLATQIRQNTYQISQSVKSQQISASQAVMTSGHHARAQIMTEPALYLKGLRDPSLAIEERLVFNLQMQAVVMNFRELYLLHHWGTLDPSLWALQEDLIRSIASEPGGRSAFEPFFADASGFASELRRILAINAPEFLSR
jgi:hypothetical protein